MNKSSKDIKPIILGVKTFSMVVLGSKNTESKSGWFTLDFSRLDGSDKLKQ